MKVRLPKYKMSNNQKQTMNAEIKKQLFEIREKSARDIDTMILWTLHKQFGFGKKRLEDFFHTFVHEYNDFKAKYEMDDAFPERIKLKEECGVDVDELYEREGLK